MTPAFFFLKWIVAQLDRAYKRLEWKYEIAKAESWRDECERRYRSLSFDARCAADAEAIWRRLYGSDRLRRNEKGHKGVRVHDENKHGGPVGYQVCSSASWDNAVRAMDEDR